MSESTSYQLILTNETLTYYHQGKKGNKNCTHFWKELKNKLFLFNRMIIGHTEFNSQQ